jgi:hypothetical protein
MKEIFELGEIYIKYQKKLDFLINSVKNPKSKEQVVSTAGSQRVINDLLISMLTTIFTEQEDKGA